MQNINGGLNIGNHPKFTPRQYFILNSILAVKLARQVVVIVRLLAVITIDGIVL